jgi:hypothetical protein
MCREQERERPSLLEEWSEVLITSIIFLVLLYFLG